MGDTFKIQAFEYLISKLIEWYNQSNSNRDNDLSVLKVLKLTFFVSAVGTDSNSEDTLLDNVFDNFVAMPYGHVESDMYTFMKRDVLPNFKITNRETTLKEDGSLSPTCDSSIKENIDNSISLLKTINKDLINLSSFDLVDLSHTWYTWQKFYSLAQSKGSNSESIPVEEIKREDKIYQL
ncbi:hypothetical protein [Tenacibaculum maritimum]|uniref:hypothetical protein n=1 Tax=Tenacibaculum maritimum TaxID=107401 RepID=UPI003875BFCB